MKKRVFIITIAFAVALAGCGKKENNTEKESAPRFITTNAVYYKNGVVYGEEPASFLDFDTMEKAPLCAVPNCTHTVSSCLAQMVGAEPIFYNNYIYYFTSNNGDVRETPDGKEFYIESKLMKASLESSETEVVCEFTDCAPPQMFGDYVLNGSELYFVGDDLNPYMDEYGGGSWGSSGGYHFLCSINLDTGEYTNYGSIYDGDKEYEFADNSSGANITGIYNDTMYIGYGFIKEEPPENADFSDNYWTFLSFEFDFGTKTWTESELPFSRYMNNDTYTYYNNEEKQLHVIHENRELVIDSEYTITQMSEFNGKLFIPEEGKWYDLSDSSEHSMGKYKEYDVVGYHDGCYILIKGGRTAKITEDELLALK